MSRVKVVVDDYGFFGIGTLNNTDKINIGTFDKLSKWKGNAFVSSLKFGQLARLEMQGNKVIKEERLINGKVGRIREVQQGSDSYTYVVTDELNSQLLRLIPAEI
ncbi:MAG: hypothetical protein HND53_02245 [Proteobacteria bacterium]|nr:hypothetical protein [Pseudomonadota bacterium]NOG59291.1 hypothetical protein [Pseudomonadota bacterium]